MLTPETIQSFRQQLKQGIAVASVPQLFPTPVCQAERMASHLKIKPSDKVLEPQAGTGRLIEACKSVTDSIARVAAVELNVQLCSHLRKLFPDVDVYCRDFLEVTPGEIGTFDKIISNPPFSLEQDIQHFFHSMKFLKPDGVISAILSEGAFFHRSKRAKAFRELIAEKEAYVVKLPDDTFKESGTSVRSRFVLLQKG